MRLLSYSLKLRNRHFLLMDLISFSLTPIVAMALRLDGLKGMEYLGRHLVVLTFIFLAIKLAIFFRAGLYKRYWRYASIDELTQITLLGLLALVIQTVLFFLVLRPLGIIPDEFPRSLAVIDGMLTLLAVGGIRYSVRMIERVEQKQSSKVDSKQVLIVGAGDAGVMIVQEMQSYPKLGMRPVAFVDDANEKQGVRIRGVPVLGRTKDIARVCRQTNVRQVIIAMPTAPGSVIRQIVGICEQADISVKTIPGMYSLLDGSVSLKQLRDIRIEDLLRREPIQTDITAVSELLRGKRVLITGGGGSIGSELCRQVLRFEPKSLIILGHGENSVFEIHNELTRWLEKGQPLAQQERSSYADKAASQSTKTHRLRSIPGGKAGKPSGTEIHTVLADIRFANRIQALFREHQPEVVFHAAAHKHVPLMEENPAEAITNNVIGTRNLLEAAQAVGVEHFVMISTDKAVNPTSVMGASKRAAELLVHKAAIESGKPYVAVRFGNVLGSRGSVVLSFQQQIAAGGPVTVTHPDMVRYFMTIPEAVQLVLQAAPLGTGGEVFMLDMGEPVKIVDLARDLIELSGLEVGRDIDIAFTGLRPGEKLFEEMFFSGEEYDRTQHEKIFISRSASSFVHPLLDGKINDLEQVAQADNIDGILSCLQSVVTEFQPVRYTMQGVGKQAVQPSTHKLPRGEAAGQPAREQKPIEINLNNQWDHPAQPRFGLD